MGGEPQRSIVAIIPARFDSSRFPGKPLVPIRGLPMIARVIARARAARRVDEVWVATDDSRIAAAASAAGAMVAMTSPAHASGTDRVAEAARLSGGDVILNLQGDEPLLDPRDIDALATALEDDDKLGAATLALPLESDDEWRRPDVVKVVVDRDGHALYFSRAPIPFARDTGGARPPGALRHVGIYGFRRDVLLGFAAAPPSRLESIEQLEQLRLLEAGVRMRVLPAVGRSIAVDRPEDVARVERCLDAGVEAERRLGPFEDNAAVR